MRKLLILCVCAFALASCSTSLSSRMEKLADKAVKKGEKMSDSKWNKCNDKFLDYLEEFAENENKLKLSEKKNIIKNSAIYSAAMVKYASKNVVSAFEDCMDEVDFDADEIFDEISKYTENLDDLLNQADEMLENAGNFLKELGL